MVSIIVPIYNVAPYLPACLDSLIQQTYRDLEIILVDDGSTDGCAAIADDYAVRDNRIQVIHQTNSGQGIARNVGLQEARGQYTLFIDPDDYIEKRACEQLVQEAEKGSFDVVIFSRKRFDNTGRCWKDIFQNATYDTGRDYIIDKLTKDFSHSSCQKIYRTDLLKKNGIAFYSGIYEDFDFSFRVMYYARKVKCIDTVLYFYRVNRPLSSVSTISDKDVIVLQAIERVERFLEEARDPLLNMDDLKLYIFNWIFNSIIIKYPCKVLFNRKAHHIAKTIIQSPTFLPYCQAVAKMPSAKWSKRVTAWSMIHCYSVFALCVYILYHIKHLIK